MAKVFVVPPASAFRNRNIVFDVSGCAKTGVGCPWEHLFSFLQTGWMASHYDAREFLQANGIADPHREALTLIRIADNCAPGDGAAIRRVFIEWLRRNFPNGEVKS